MRLLPVMASTNTQVDASLGERVRARRLELGLSQRDIQQPGLNYAYVSRIEAGQRKPTLSAVIALAKALDTNALWLLTGEHAQVECPLCGHKHGGRRNGKRNRNGNGRP